MILILVTFLTELYLAGENTFEITEFRKITEVNVKRKKFALSDEAKSLFAKIHDDWEMNICKRFDNDSLVSGLYFIFSFVIISSRHKQSWNVIKFICRNPNPLVGMGNLALAMSNPVVRMQNPQLGIANPIVVNRKQVSYQQFLCTQRIKFSNI